MRTRPRDTWGTISTRHYIAVAALAVVIGIIAVIESTLTVNGPGDTDQLAFFFPSAQQVLDGHPFAIYAVRAFGNYPNFNPPLATLLIAPLLAIGQGFLPGASACVASGYGDASCRSLLGFVGILFIPFAGLWGAATLAALRRAFPSMSQGQAFTAFALVMLSPLMWQNFTIWWHFEQPMMLFFFVAGVWQLQCRRYWLTGAFLGLALMTRTTAAVPLIALLVVLAVEREWNALAKVAGVIAAVSVLALGPFFLGDRADTTYALLTWRGTAPIGNSIWAIFSNTPLDHIARRLDLPSAILVAALIGLYLAQRRGVSAFSRDIYAVLALAALLVPMLSKTAWPYYYAEPFVFIVIYEFATLQDAPLGLWRWPVISLAFVCAASTLSQFIGVRTGGGISLRLMGLIEFASMLAFAVAVWQRFIATHSLDLAAESLPKSAALSRPRP